MKQSPVQTRCSTPLASAAAFAAISVFAAQPSFAQRDFSKVEIKTVEVASGVYMLTGAGGNIGLSTGDDGAFVIDDQFAPLSEKIMAAIKSVTDDDVVFLVNTHWHFDHTGGNEKFSQGGAQIIAHENVRKRLIEGMESEMFTTPPAPDDALPVITFSEGVNFHWNGGVIEVRHYGAGHTDGDAIIHFKDANVVHMGDQFFNGGFPFVDLNSGGDLDAYIAVQETVLASVDDETKIIPGHGPLATKTDLEGSIAMLKDVRARVQKQIDDGLNETDAVAANPLADLDGQWGQGFINAERMTSSAYQSLQNAE